MVDGRSTPSRLSASSYERWKSYFRWRTRFASRMKKPSRRRLSLVPHAQTSRPYRSDANTAELRNLPLSRAGTVLLRKTRLFSRSTTDSAQQILCFTAGGDRRGFRVVLLPSCEERQLHLAVQLHFAAWLGWSSTEWMIYFYMGTLDSY